jgi:phosphoribosylformimino-5-aminoimidazole carboxamide ribotide isomerase
MQVIPVIDLKGGQVVHARAGDRAAYRPIETPLSRSSAPRDVVAGLLGLFPFRRLYVADLDAITGDGDHDAVLGALAAAHPGLELWVDNGIGALATARAWLARRIGHLVLGSESQTGSDVLAALRGDPRIVLSLDFRADAFQGPRAILDDPGFWPARVIVMTLARVGATDGPDFERLVSIRRHVPDHRLYAAGGVRHAADVTRLAQLGAAGALVATALHAGAITGADLGRLAEPDRRASDG